MCNRCYQPSCNGTCNGCCSGCEADCPIKLDFDCIIYSKDGKYPNSLDGLNITGSPSLLLVVEALDEKIKQLNVSNFILTYLRGGHVVNTMQQFAESVDDELSTMATTIAGINANNNLALTVSDSASIDLISSGTLGHTLTANAKLSQDADNLLTIESDGLFAHPQTLSVNYTTKTLSISNGNSVNLSSLIFSPSGFLGNVASDPGTTLDGNYWYNTTSSQLKIRVNNAVRIITIT